ncbi:LysR family transcriptional regulator, partial [Acinetobacter gerneri]
LSTGLESVLNIVIASELLDTNWTDYVSLISKQFPDLQINITSAPQEDALAMLLDQRAQLAWMFERENLDYREQFVEIKKESLIPV